MERNTNKGIPFRDLLTSLPEDEQESTRARSQESIQRELTLQDLRKGIRAESPRLK